MNAGFNLCNHFHEYSDYPIDAYCLKCHGKKQADWVEIVNGRIDDEMKALYRRNRKLYSSCFKSDLLHASEMDIEDLHRIKEVLDFFGCAIEDLNEIESYDDSEYVFEDFEFTWNNLMDKFKLPCVNKYTPVPEGVFIFD